MKQFHHPEKEILVSLEKHNDVPQGVFLKSSVEKKFLWCTLYKNIWILFMTKLVFSFNLLLGSIKEKSNKIFPFLLTIKKTNLFKIFFKKNQFY